MTQGVAEVFVILWHAKCSNIQDCTFNVQDCAFNVQDFFLAFKIYSMFIQNLFKIYSMFIQDLFKIYSGMGNMLVMRVTSCELQVVSCK